jgi:hypothetical protein
MSTVRWNVVVSPETDQSFRLFLASQGGGRKGDLSRFIEDAVRSFIFSQAVDAAKRDNGPVSDEDLAAAIDEALAWARRG